MRCSIIEPSQEVESEWPLTASVGLKSKEYQVHSGRFYDFKFRPVLFVMMPQLRLESRVICLIVTGVPSVLVWFSRRGTVIADAAIETLDTIQAWALALAGSNGQVLSSPLFKRARIRLSHGLSAKIPFSCSHAESPLSTIFSQVGLTSRNQIGGTESYQLPTQPPVGFDSFGYGLRCHLGWF
jgi:hypothetical protein